MNEQARRQAIRLKLARQSGGAPGILPTGFRALDAALGGGFPRGSIVELFGSSCGKTTLALQAVAHLQGIDCAAGWIDADRTFDPAWAAALGVAVARLPLAQPESAEQALEIARRLVASGALDLLVVDSAAALAPRLELAAGIAESVPGLHGRVLASGLRGLSVAAARARATILFLNQARTRMERGGGEPETSAGGPALKLYAAVRVTLAHHGGRQVRFRVLKNKAAGGFASGELEWEPGGGFAKSP
jgi:recombination protein RecA